MIINLVLVGETNVGKTSISHRYNRNMFSEYIVPTCYNCDQKEININNNSIRLQTWEQNRDDKMGICNGKLRINGLLIVFDVTDQMSFIGAQYFYKKMYEERYPPHSVDVILIGNKIDLGDKREVSKEEAEQFAFEKNMHYFETSAKVNEGIDDAFTYIATSICNRICQEKEVEQNEISKSETTFSEKCLNALRKFFE